MNAKAMTEAKPTSAVRPLLSLTPAHSLQLQRANCACGRPITGGGECESCRKKRLQRAASGPLPTAVPGSVQSVLSSSGRPLEPGTRTDMEARFGHDFSQVRVHDGLTAAQSAREVNARAYTVGQDVVFGGEGYQPQTSSGRSLLAHELAHTIQQRGLQRSSSSLSLDQGAEYQRLESEAESAAAQALRGEPVNVSRPASQPTLSRAGTPAGQVVPATSKKTKFKKSDFGSHSIKPVEAFESSKGKVEEYDVNVLYVPGEKGQLAYDEYVRIGGGKLESTVELTGSGRARTALWQTRPSTDDLRKLWLEKLGWSASSKDDLWKRAGGDAEFPKVGGSTCQMDHSIELQLGGDNTPPNIQPLNAGPNQASGRDINKELTSLVKEINDDADLSGDDTTQFKLRFAAVKPVGVLDKVPTACPPTAAVTCLDVEHCAKKLKLAKDEKGNVSIARDDYPVSVGGGSPRVLKTPDTFKTSKTEVVPIEGDYVNGSMATLIPGLLLTSLAHRKGTTAKPDVITARIDDRPETRLPVSLDAKSKPVSLNVAADGVLTLNPADKKGGFAFTYKYLSPGQITSMALNESGGVDWTGYIKPAIPLLGQLDVAYKAPDLTLTKALPVKSPVPGVRIVETSLGLKLAPEFKPEGKLKLEFGPEGKPLAAAELTASTDGKGFIAKGQLKVFIPGVDKAEADITYMGGGEYGAGSWTGTITIESSQIKLPYVQSGSVTAKLAAGKGIDVEGKLALALPGENSANVSLKRTEAAWILSGQGTFKVPRVGTVNAWVTYNTSSKLLGAGVKDISTNFQFLGLTATLKDLSVELQPEKSPVFSGAVRLDIKKGKAQGSADLLLNRNGKFSGKGTVTYPLRENLVVTGTVILDEKEKLRFEGELLITRFKLFDGHEQKKDIFSIKLPIPIPGLSIGKAGLVANIRGGLSAGYSFGPGVIEPLKFSAGFSPLEDDPDVELGVNGKLSIPAKAWITAKISGGIALEIDAIIASAGAEAGLEFSGTATLGGEVFATLDAKYKQKKLTAKMTAGLTADLTVGAALTAYVLAYAKFLGFGTDTRYDWKLAEAKFPTGLQFKLSAPFGYDSETGITLPTLDQVEVTKPELNLKSVLGDAFGRKPPKTTEL